MQYSLTVSIHHVYMENNEMVDGFPKARLLLDVSQWHI
jgi:hypothetical protein